MNNSKQKEISNILLPDNTVFQKQCLTFIDRLDSVIFCDGSLSQNHIKITYLTQIPWKDKLRIIHELQYFHFPG
jgi:hypothetical protein